MDYNNWMYKMSMYVFLHSCASGFIEGIENNEQLERAKIIQIHFFPLVLEVLDNTGTSA